MLQWWWRAVLWRRRSGIWEESLSGQVKVQWLTLCYSSLRPECWDCDGQQHGIHISQVSPENTNYGRNQLQTLQITAPKSGKTEINRAITVTLFDKMLHWTQQKNEIGRIKIRNTEILHETNTKSKKSGNPTVLQASRKVAKSEDAGQEAPVKLCVKNFFIKKA